MTIYDFIETLCDTCCDVFTLFDCNTEDLVEVETDDGAKTKLSADALLWSDYADYEIGGIDTWIENGNIIHFELNIEVEEDDE